MQLKISVIVPTFNEEKDVVTLLHYLQSCPGEYIQEVIVVDAGSTDRTIQKAKELVTPIICLKEKGRALQMNRGAEVAQGEILYFLHVDSLPPFDFAGQIIRAVQEGYKSGCFCLKYDDNHWWLKINAWYKRFNFLSLRYGDQSLYVTKDIFQKIGGFDTTFNLLEDQEIIKRICIHTKFKVLPDYIITSARKYLQNGIFRLQAVYFFIYFLYRLGVSQNKLVSIYKKLIR